MAGVFSYAEVEMSGNQNRKNDKTVREIQQQLAAATAALETLTEMFNKLAAAHNSLQGYLIAIGVLPDSSVKKPKLSSKDSK
jgi:hypothetical protein